MRLFTLVAAGTTLLSSVALVHSAPIVQEVFVTANPTSIITSNILGLDITNHKDENIGKIEDVIINDDVLTGYIVSVGGFLGVGEKYVIVSPLSVKITYSESDKKWWAKMDTTKELLEKAPEFKYEGRWGK
ncbi:MULTISPECIES: PRC-barrel domain-containing protein [unclassified Bartonella]|uniref:PRC-barrel domain-containing protein n=1 Tax=unclassified Bartonella TaxID=2645622 RepID=UPI0015F925D5|nr:MULTISPECIES: PRC-barrel domain-containing protein [unclassified Bartonella]UXN03331.1 PRC-barrel domain-containing protein [Bartonella sp. HY406]UXN06287.1 PRC-barrel domain-containing protein [Bartonella sp. HY761]